MANFILLITAGLCVGSVYVLIAIGFNFTFWTTRTVNFGQAAVMMLGALLTALLISRGYSVPLSLLTMFMVVSAIMLFIEGLAVRPALKKEGSMGWVVSTLGAGMVIQGVVSALNGSNPIEFPDLIFTAGSLVEPLPGIFVSLQYVAIFALAVVLVVLFEIFLRFTISGRAMIAVSMDAELARVVGIPLRRVVLTSYLASGLLAALSGILIAQLSGTVDPAFGFEIMVFGFVAAVVGGMGSLFGALVAGLSLGVLEKIIGGYISSAAQHSVAFAALIIVLIVRPDGLFGSAQVRKP
jgi:branched-chain amino acid transport system permease protein